MRCAKLANVTIPYIDALIELAPLHRLTASVLIFHDDPTDNTTLAVPPHHYLLASTNPSLPFPDHILTTPPSFDCRSTTHAWPGTCQIRQVLHSWAARERRVRLLLSDMADRGERIQRLTLCRNVLLAGRSTFTEYA